VGKTLDKNMKKKTETILKKWLEPRQLEVLRLWSNKFGSTYRKMMYPYGRFIKTYLNMYKNSSKVNRRLEIGPGIERISGFETVNIVWGRDVDYVADASRRLPFSDDTYELIYASHILEHIPWYSLQSSIEEWVRVVSSGGCLEVWVPNGLLIAKTFVNVEEGRSSDIHMDGWYKFNKDRDPCLWANGRIFSYGDGTGKKNDPNWHMTLFSPRFLRKVLEESGLINLELLERTEVRGHDHGWINLGYRGYKP